MDFSAFRDMKPFSQLMFALFVMVASGFIISIVGVLVSLPFFGSGIVMRVVSATDLNSTDEINFLKYMQVLQSAGLFIVPPVILGFFYYGRIGEYLQTNRTTRYHSFVLASLCIAVSIPFINFLGEINSRMSFPESLSWLELSLKNMEENAKILVDKFMAVDGIPGLLVNIFIIAVIPAIGEELMFRGVFQRIFTRWTKNCHWGIWITAILFSAIHMQFYGFLPRMLLGAMFGYLLVWTWTIWVPILAHFINNLIGVAGFYLINKGFISNHIEDVGAGSDQFPLVLLSALLVAGILYTIYRLEKQKTKMPVNQGDSQA